VPTLVRRFVVLAALLFWEGGFTFYAAVVVEVGQQQIGHRQQGFITREVAYSLNLAGGIALVLLAWDTTATRQRSARRRMARWGAWGWMAVTLVVLVALYREMDGLLIAHGGRHDITDPDWFRKLHRWYLWTITAQWVAALVYGWLTLQAWRDEDQAKATGISESRVGY
jgi:hypothetical protein